jgi:hypothetical protein
VKEPPVEEIIRRAFAGEGGENIGGSEAWSTRD